MPQLMIVNPSHHSRRHKKTRARKNPSHHKRRARRNPLVMDLGGRKGLRKYRVRHNPSRRHRRMRRNPFAPSGGVGLGAQLVPVAAGAAAALGVDLLMQKLPIPVNFKMGMPSNLVRAAGAIGIGLLAGIATKNKGLGARVTAGALTVTVYDMLKGFMAQRAAAAMVASQAVSMRMQGAEDTYPYVGWAGQDNLVASDEMGELVPGMGELLERGDY